MKIIPLTRGFVTFVSDRDYLRLRRFNWFAQRTGNGFRAARQLPRVNGRQCIRYMHHEILGCAQVDHRDRNALNNLRSNLRPATPAQNAWNRACRRDSTNGYKGVTQRPSGLWRARIMIGYRRFCLGNFSDPISAARAYDSAAVKYFGKFACLNFPKTKTH